MGPSVKNLDSPNLVLPKNTSKNLLDFMNQHSIAESLKEDEESSEPDVDRVGRDVEDDQNGRK